MITQDYLKECLAYDPTSGAFTWLERCRSHFNTARAFNAWNVRYAGKTAGSVLENGYVSISIDSRAYRAHRLAILYMTGRMPSDLVDHANLIRSDNRFPNLREATRSQNGANRADVYASSGVKGVTWHVHTGKWQARIRVSGNSKYLGLYSELEDAKEAYRLAAHKYFGEFGREAILQRAEEAQAA
ncbi:hypothetical protein QBD01_003703 [Ochrobactrum sp. 19YEA23]|uniref:HNH endonuclease n=1 Tax=Ochrobactrum sp. 19YEA23 TaxID=3039854 RepID=UPI0024792CA2|nr:hypothetical protein [Ochrobactrum sp. 19YEA23]